MTGDSVPFSVRAQIMCPFLMFFYRPQSCNYDIYTLYHVSPMQTPVQYIYTLTTTAYNNCTKQHHNTTSPHLSPRFDFWKIWCKMYVEFNGNWIRGRDKPSFNPVQFASFPYRCGLHRYYALTVMVGGLLL